MEPFAKNTKKKAKKAGVGAGRSSERREKQDAAAVPMDISASLQDEEELISYQPEAPPSFSPIQDDVFSPEALTPIPEEQTSDQSPFAHELPAFSAEDGPSVSAKRSQIFSDAAHTTSPPPTPDLAELDTAYHPPNANKHVETTGEPESAKN
jgi:hypothetical protein